MSLSHFTQRLHTHAEQYSFSSVNYLNTSAPPYFFYERKHNPLIIYDSVASVDSRRALIRNFNDFAVDVNASALPQWMFVTPNMVDDAHDTTIDFAGDWVDFWLVPLLNNTNFNDNRTLILLTFDETETYTVNNQIFALLLGGAIPDGARGTVDSTYYTHYSSLSTVEANWGLGSLGRGDTNKYVSFPQPTQKLTSDPAAALQDTLERLLTRCQRDELHKSRRLRGRYPTDEPDRQYPRPAQRKLLRALHGAEHVRRRRGRRSRIHCLRPRH